MHNVKARDRPYSSEGWTLSIAQGSIVNAFIHESQKTLSLLLYMSMKLMTVDVHQLGLVYSLLFATHKALKELRQKNSIELYIWPQRGVSHLSTEQQANMKWGIS